MNENKEQQHQPPDPNLDIPAEANRGKHINFRETEESNTETGSDSEDNGTAERKKQWKEGLEEGERARRNNP